MADNNLDTDEGRRSNRGLDTYTILALVWTVVLAVITLVKAKEIWPVAFVAAAFIIIAVLLRARSGTDAEKEVIVTVSHVAADRLQPYTKSLSERLSKLGRVRVQRSDAGTITISLLTARPLNEIIDRVNALGLKAELAGVKCEVLYHSIAASAEMLVEIRGQAPPDSFLSIPGLAENVPVDKTGAYSVRVPLSVLKKHAGRHRAATFKRGSLEEQIKIPVPK